MWTLGSHGSRLHPVLDSSIHKPSVILAYHQERVLRTEAADPPGTVRLAYRRVNDLQATAFENGDTNPARNVEFLGPTVWGVRISRSRSVTSDVTSAGILNLPRNAQSKYGHVTPPG